MAFNMQSGDGDELQEQHDINVTPFIDVMLVLLIIFMVAAPLATVSVPVELPSIAAPEQPAEKKPHYLTLQKDLTLTLGERDVVTRDNIAQVLQARSIEADQRILLRSDSQVEYGEVISVMNALAEAGYNKIALVGLESTL